MSVTAGVQLQEIPQEPSEWRYRGEGNENAVFAYVGNSPEIQGWLLRLSKCKQADKRESDSAYIQEKLDTVAYSADVIGSLIGKEYILPQKLVAVSTQFMQQLAELAEGTRPEHRTHKQISEHQCVATLTHDMLSSSLTDAADGEPRDVCRTVTVEIKPKWGFLPSSDHISRRNAIKHRVCRYCMYQYLKHGSERVSTFCPLDLFSENRPRVLHALQCLSLSPQNNLHVFVDGHNVADSGSGPIEDVFPQWQELKASLADVILQESLFPRLKYLQRRLDPFDIEGILPKYQQAVSAGTLDNSQPSIPEWIAAVDNFKQGEQALSSSSAKHTVDSDNQAILEFLLSTTLKDISVMIQFCSWPTNPSIQQPAKDYRIAIIDSDPKKLCKIPDYFKKDQRIVANYLAQDPNIVDTKECHD
ncbi:hypothetical protein GGI12_001644 [Dipsacomyces acuminosporus]|nr:hypothetical protein GGI12_001644 [Dipsacomyces acuminosporus]